MKFFGIKNEKKRLFEYKKVSVSGPLEKISSFIHDINYEERNICSGKLNLVFRNLRC